MTQLPLFAAPAEPEAGTQCARLLDYLRHHKSINPLQCWSLLGIYRLSARVFDLRKAGHPIVTETIIVHNRWNEPTHVASYSLMEL